MKTTQTITVTLPLETLQELEHAAESEERSRSNMIARALNEWRTQRERVTGPSRLADLERLANSKPNKGDTTMTDPKTNGSKQGTVPEKEPHPAERSGPATNEHGTSGGYPGSRSAPATSPKKTEG
jgi:hypothetical protein